MQDISHIFRSYDIRGIYGKDLDEEIMKRIGNAFSRFTKSAVVSRDMRQSSPSLHSSFLEGFTEAGGNALDTDILPLGVAIFFAWQQKKELAYITASHLGKEWNGAKFFHSSGLGFLEKENYKLRDLVIKDKYSKARKKGKAKTDDSKKIISDYINFLAKKIKASKKLRVAMDFGNGAASLVGAELFKKCGFDIIPVFEDLDGTFPNRNPEPQEDELNVLKRMISECDLGIAYDGDGDRMLLIDSSGRKLSAEQTSYLILSELLKKEKGPIVANVECTRLVDYIANKFGRKVVRIPVGHTFLINETRKHKACFGLEVAGHYTIPSILPFDDAMLISLYAAYSLSKQEEPLQEIISELPEYFFERISISCDDKKKFLVIEKLKKSLKKKYKNVLTIDGVRIELPNGWVLIRASNTSPLIRLTVEAGTHGDLEKLKDEFLSLLEDEMSKV